MRSSRHEQWGSKVSMLWSTAQCVATWNMSCSELSWQKAGTVLNIDNTPRAIEMACWQTRVRTPEAVWDSRKEVVACLTAFCSSNHARRLGRQDDEMGPGNASVLTPVLDRGGKATFPACSPGRIVAHAMQRPSRCHSRDDTRKRHPRGVASGSQLPESQQKSCQRLRQRATGRRQAHSCPDGGGRELLEIHGVGTR